MSVWSHELGIGVKPAKQSKETTMKKVEQIGDKYYIDGQEVELVKKPEPKQTPGQVWVERPGCPVAGHGGPTLKCHGSCSECHRLLALAFDAGRASLELPTVEEWWDTRPTTPSPTPSPCYYGGGKMPCEGMGCAQCKEITSAAVAHFRKLCVARRNER